MPILIRSSQQINCMTNPNYSWLKPNLHHLPGSSSGPINLLTSVRSSQDIPDVITAGLSTNEKKLKHNMTGLQTGCMAKSTSNSKVQSSVGSGEHHPTPRRQVSDVFLNLLISCYWCNCTKCEIYLRLVEQYCINISKNNRKHIFI